jgi:hypothetical protein
MALNRARGVAAAAEPLHRVAAQFGQQMAHGGEQQVVLAVEVVMHDAGRHPGARGNPRNGGFRIAVVMQRADGGCDELVPADRTHADLWHWLRAPCAVIVLSEYMRGHFAGVAQKNREYRS